MTKNEGFDWGAYEFVMQYAVDAAEHHAVAVGVQRLKITREVFATKLFVERGGFESELLQLVKGGGAPLYFVGERGQGKSSALYWVQHQLRNIKDFEKMLVVDVQKLLDKVDPDLSATQITKVFGNILRLHFLEELFGTQRLRFLAWVLAGPPDANDNFDQTLLIEFGDLSARIRMDAEAEDAPSREKRRSKLEKYFGSTAGKKVFGEVDKAVQSLVRPEHVLQCALIVKPLPYLVVAYDNIDQLHGPWQARVLDLIEAIHAALSGACGSVIAIRRENVAHLMEGPGGGAYAVRVMVASSRPYLGLQLPEDSESHARAVLEKRHVFAKALVAEYLRSTQHDQVRLVDRLHEDILSEMVSAHIQKLANYNMRTIVRMYVEFRRYVRKSVDLGDTLEAGHVATLLFRWLFEEGETFGIELHDVFRLGRVVHTIEDVPRAASVHHLLMTCLYNLMSRQQKNNAPPPRFKEVFDRMHSLGFSLEHVKSALDSLCNKPGMPPKIVVFDGDNQRIEELTETSGSRLQLTVCGLELVSHVFSRVGYVWGRAYEHHDTFSSGKGYIDLPRAKRIEILLSYMTQMARQHLYLLESIRMSWSEIHGADWLKLYREYFGVNDRLQVERILDSAGKFFRPNFSPEQSPFYLLKDAYTRILEALNAGGEVWKERLPELDQAIDQSHSPS